MKLDRLNLPVSNDDVPEWLMDREGVHDDETDGKYADLYNFLWRHPDAEIKLRDVRKIIVKVRTNRGTAYPEVFLQTSQGALVDISWRKCITRKRETPRQLTLRAMRNAVSTFIATVRDNASPFGRCELCGEMLGADDGWHVDHIIPFRTLAATFMLTRPKLWACVIDDVKGHPTLNPASPECVAWIEYHNEAAELRVVHADCNLRRPRSDDE